jgi:hypothetical protein
VLQDQYSVEHRKDVIAFDPNKPLKLYALTENGEANEVHDIDGDQTQVLESIKGTWRLMPDVSGLSKLYNLLAVSQDFTDFQRKPPSLSDDRQAWRSAALSDYPVQSNHVGASTPIC